MRTVLREWLSSGSLLLASVGVAAAAWLIVPRAALADVGIPCDPGSSSATGFQPCTPCAAGTFTGDTGSDHCLACPAGRFASATGATVCAPCPCDDGVACTIDACGATTGICSEAVPVPACQPVKISFEGTITGSDAGPFDVLFLGEPIAGYFVLDPLAPDHLLDPTVGDYPNGVGDLFVLAGDTNGGRIEGLGTGVGTKDLQILDRPGQDEYTVDASGLGLASSGSIFGIDDVSFYLSLQGGDAPQITSDALLAEAPDAASFTAALATFTLHGPTIDTTLLSTDVTLSPEPSASGVGLAAATALAALRVRRRPHAAGARFP
jgi:hypothetical protein